MKNGGTLALLAAAGLALMVMKAKKNGAGAGVEDREPKPDTRKNNGAGAGVEDRGPKPDSVKKKESDPGRTEQKASERGVSEDEAIEAAEKADVVVTIGPAKIHSDEGMPLASDELKNLAATVAKNIAAKKYDYDRSLMRKFQSLAGLTGDGLYGPATRMALGRYVSAPPALFAAAKKKGGRQ